MTIEEADFILSNDEFEEIYDEKLFELKQFFVSRLIHPKLFNSRLAKLKTLNEAFSLKGGKFESFDVIDIKVEGQEVLNVFNSYSEGIGKIRTLILRSNNGREVDFLVTQLISLTNNYASKWEESNLIADELTKVSEQFDPMDIYNEIVRQNSKGIVAFDQLINLSNDNILVKEAKRLNLWRKLYADG